MNDIYMDKPLLPFIFVGCWNAKGAGRDAVIKAINRHPVTNLVLGGDNFYPTKKRTPAGKIKSYDVRLLKPHLFKKNVFTALGNHNIDVFKTADGNKQEVLELEKKLDWHIPAGPPYYYIVRYTDLDLMILDTNLCDPEYEDKEAFNTMMEWTQQYLVSKDEHRQYYCVMHEPIISAKIKNSKEASKNSSIIQELSKSRELLSVLTISPPIAILCADTHNYQQVFITYTGVTIPQIVVGTGGAEPDTVDWSKYTVDTPLGDDIVFSIARPSKDEQEAYGFVVFDVDGQHSFNYVRPWNLSGGSRKRVRRNRQTRRKLRIR
jgi:hypothetical protein